MGEKTFRIKDFFLLLLNMLMVVLAILTGTSMYMIVAFMVWIDIVYFCLKDLDRRGALFAYLLAFFTFLMGRELLECLNLHDIEAVFEPFYNTHAERLILISLVSLAFGYLVLGNIEIRNTRKKKIDNTNQIMVIRKVSSLLFFGTYIFHIYEVMDIVRFVLSNGYTAFYVSYVSHVPYIISKLGDISPIAFWVYLSTLPSKKDSRLHILGYVGYLFITLGTGKRYPFMAGLLILFIYYTARNQEAKNESDKWFGKKEKMVCLILLPLLLIAMVLMNVVRFGNQFSVEVLYRGIFEFFYGQGVSINVLKRTLIYGPKLPAGKYYTFGSIMEFLHDNIISRKLGIIGYSGNSVDHAMKGYSLQHALSYVAMGQHYLDGHGFGSSYIAEVFHDFSYAGVVVINILYGVMLKKITCFYRYNVWINTILLCMLNSFILAPRSSADKFLISFVDFTTWGTIILISMISCFCRDRYYSSKK